MPCGAPSAALIAGLFLAAPPLYPDTAPAGEPEGVELGAGLGAPEIASRKVRLDTANRLAREATDSSLIALVSLIDDVDVRVRMVAAEALAGSNTAHTATAIERAIRWIHVGNQDEALRGLTVLQAATHLTDDAALAVISLLTRQQAPVRIAGFVVLEGHDWPVPLSVATLAAADESAEVRLAAVAALHRLGDRRALATLVEGTADSDARVSRAALAALDEIADPAALPALRRMLRNENAELRAATVPALAALAGVPEAMELLGRSVHAGNVDGTSAAAIAALGRVRTRQAAVILVQRIRLFLGGDPLLDDITTALAAIGTPAEAPLIDLLNDSDQLQDIAVRTLAQLTSRMAAPPPAPGLPGRPAVIALARQLQPQAENGSSGPLLREILTALGRAHGAEALPELYALTSDRSQSVRRLALQAMLDIGDPGALDAVVPALEDKDPGVRGLGARLAGQLLEAALDIPDPVLQALVAHLDDDQQAVRHEALRALGNVNADRASPEVASRVVAALLAGRSALGPSDALLARALTRWARLADLPVLVAATRDAPAEQRLALLDALASLAEQSAERGSDAVSDAFWGPDDLEATVAIVRATLLGSEVERLAGLRLARAIPVVGKRISEPLRGRFPDLTGTERTLACPVLALTNPGRHHLAALISDEEQAPELRAAARTALAAGAGLFSAGPLTVVVTRPDGSPVPGLAVKVASGPAGASDWVVTGATGAILLGPTAATLSVTHDQGHLAKPDAKTAVK